MDWKEKYEQYRNAYEKTRNDLKNYQKQYDGQMQPKDGREVTCIYNFTKELIESELDISIPMPKVEHEVYNEKNQKLAKIVENMLRGEIKRLSLEAFNDIDERNTKIYGGDIALIDWDNTQKTHTTVGAIGIQAITPVRFVPQPNIDSIDKMDCIFLDFEMTKKEVKRRYGKDVSSEEMDGGDTVGDTVTIHFCFYKNKSSIGCYSWVGDVVIIDEPTYNARQVKVCKKCGLTKPIGKNECICGSKEWERRNLKYEELTEDKVTAFGTIPAMSFAKENGEFLYRDVEVEQREINPYTGEFEPIYEQIFDEKQNIIGERVATKIEKQAYMEQTKIPYYVPKGYPALIRKNVTHTGQILGDSDCEFIKELQLQANMLATRMIDKMKKQGSILIKPRAIAYDPANTEQVVELETPEQMAMIGTKDLNFDTSQNIALINQFYYWAKSELGINDSSQGKADSTALSGAAKEAQINRALGRQESKVKMKNAFYSAIYRKIFEYMLAYADEPRKYTSIDELGDATEVIFDRYDFLEQDEFGNWFYNDQFLFGVDASGSASESRQFILETMQNDFLGGLYGDVTNAETIYNLWKDRASYGYPNAERQVARWKMKADEQKKIAEQMSQMGIVNQDLKGENKQATTQEQAINSVTGKVFGNLGG